MKVCNACGQEKPLSDFFGPYLDTNTGRRRWKGACKACAAERQAAVRPKRPGKYALARERRLRDYPGSKVCTGCVEEKPLADFRQPRRHNRAAGRIGLVFNARCLACQSKAVTARRAPKAEGVANPKRCAQPHRPEWLRMSLSSPGKRRTMQGHNKLDLLLIAVVAAGGFVLIIHAIRIMAA